MIWKDLMQIFTKQMQSLSQLKQQHTQVTTRRNMNQEERYAYYLSAFQRGFAKNNIQLNEVTFDDLIPDSLKTETETQGEQQ
jgi:hypothetical protein